MSAPPILPGQTHPALPVRDAQHPATSSSVQTVSAVGPTITATAVQQAQNLGESDNIERLKRAIMEDNRARLVGPSPAFQVSLLQHLRETQSSPPTEDLPKAAPPEVETQDTPVAHAPYKALQGMSEAEDPFEPHLARRI